jgi:ribose transport system ATP-binding protein
VSSVDTPLLAVESVTRRFPGVVALDNVSLDLLAGEVHVLLGENGAGKSTLIKILAGVQAPSSGSIRLDGREVHFRSAGEARDAGIRTVFQELSLVPTLTVAENLLLGRLPRTWGLVSMRKLRAAAGQALARIDANIPLDVVVSSLPRSSQQLIEIAKGLLGEARILILDEPTSSLGTRESEKLLGIVRKLRADGLGIIYITHRMHEIAAIGDRVTVLRDGAFIATVGAQLEHEKLVELMTGRPVEKLFPRSERSVGETLFSLDDVVSSQLANVDLEVRAGEIVGVAGLLGSGKSSVGRVAFGLEKLVSGNIRLAGSAYRPRGPRNAIARGLMYYPADRKVDGLVLVRPLLENLSLGSLIDVGLARFGLINRRAESLSASGLVDALDIRPAHLWRRAELLSGGNQQKAVLSRGLLRDCAVHVFDDPTVGIDVGAKVDVYRLLDRLACEGKALVLISSDLGEVIGMCDRTYVMHEGRIVGELSRAETSEEALVSHFFGKSKAEQHDSASPVLVLGGTES